MFRYIYNLNRFYGKNFPHLHSPGGVEGPHSARVRVMRVWGGIENFVAAQQRLPFAGQGVSSVTPPGRFLGTEPPFEGITKALVKDLGLPFLRGCYFNFLLHLKKVGNLTNGIKNLRIRIQRHLIPAD